MKYIQKLFKFFALILAISQLEASRPYTIEILDGNFTILDWDVVKSINYKIYDRKVIYVDYVLKQNINEFDIKLKLDLIKKDNRRTNLLKLTLNGCDSLEGAQKSKILKTIYREMFRVTNVPTKCPVLADTFYYFKNFTVKEDDFPMIAPAMEWQLNADFISHNTVNVAGILRGRVSMV